jgi:hypothetical protein
LDQENSDSREIGLKLRSNWKDAANPKEQRRTKKDEMEKIDLLCQEKGSSRWELTSAYSVDDAADGLAKVDITVGGDLAGGQIAWESPCIPRDRRRERGQSLA